MQSQSKSAQVIYTTFAGRRENLELGLPHVDELIDKGQVDEVHLWNYARLPSDSIWLKQTFGGADPLVFTTLKHDYRPLPLKAPVGSEGGLKEIHLGVRGKSDGHILLMDAKNPERGYEIVLGGWANSRSVIRTFKEKTVLADMPGAIMREDAFVRVAVEAGNGRIAVFLVGPKGERMMVMQTGGVVKDGMTVHVAAFHQMSVDFDLQPLADAGALVLPAADGYKPRNIAKFKYIKPEKGHSWGGYYEHYTQQRYPNHVIIKADDDIVYIDTATFPRYIEARLADPAALLMFPSIINNGVCAHIQQKAGLIPASVGEFPYDTFQGKLWSSAALCDSLHTHFCQNKGDFVNRSRILPPIKVALGDRVSINMFAILSKDLPLFQKLVEGTPDGMDIDDEMHLSVTMSKMTGRQHSIVMGTVVSHLSFFQQVDNGLDLPKLRTAYRGLLP